GPVVLDDVHVVGQVEPPFGLHDEREHRQDVPVFAPQAQLHVVLEPFDVLVAHRPTPSLPGSAGSPAPASFRAYRPTYRSRSSRYSVKPLKDNRWIGQGPYRAMAARCDGVP